MSAVRCPRCEESFRVPDSSLPPGIRLRCPWCTEIFDASELSHRLPPMAELIDEEGRFVDLRSIVAANVGEVLATDGAMSSRPGFASTQGKDLLNNDPVNRIEPGEVDVEGFEFVDQHSDTVRLTGEPDDGLPEPVRVFDSDQFDDDSVAKEPNFEIQTDDEYLEADEEFDDDSDYDPDFDPDYDPDYDEQSEYEDEYGDEDLVEEVDSRVPVEGPVAPRPLSTAVVHDFSKTHVTAKPRAKKSSSAIKTAIGVVVGFLMAVPLAGGLLTLLGQKPDWGFYPFNGQEIKVTASQPMQRNDDSDRSPSVNLPGQEGLPVDAFAAEKPKQLAPTVSDRAAPAEIEYGIDLEMDSPTKSVPRSPDLSVPSSDVSEDATTTNEVSPKPNLETPTMASLDALMTETASTDTKTAVQPQRETSDPPKVPSSNVSSVETTEKLPPAISSVPVVSSTNSLDDMVTAPDGESPTAIELPASEPSSTVSFVPAASPQLTAAIDEAEVALRVVTDFPNDGTANQLKLNKSVLYASIGKVATITQNIKQPETTELINAVIASGLVTEMASVAPNWLSYAKRTHEGLFAEGEVFQEKDLWMMKCDGIKGPATVQLKDFDAKEVTSGDRFIILARILDSSPPAIVRVVYMKKK